MYTRGVESILILEGRNLNKTVSMFFLNSINIFYIKVHVVLIKVFAVYTKVNAVFVEL